jgi:hypothetical protein
MKQKKVVATDNEALAVQLWGDDKHWNEERGQWCPGNSSSTSNDEQPTTSTADEAPSPSTAPTTEPPSSKETAEPATAPSTGGSGPATPTPASPPSASERAHRKR